MGLGYAAALIALVVTVGVPTDRASLLLIILAGLAIPCLGQGWRAYRRVLLDWLPFTAVLVVYDVSRGLATWVGLPLHMSDIAAADRDMFGGTVPTVWLQDHFLHPGAPTWYDALATLVYITHFLATPIVAAVLWVRNREIWIQFITRVIALSVAGLVTYVLFPAAPPWYAAREGVIEPVIRASSRGWLWLHINHAGNLLSAGQLAANPVAAMPSLHTAFATLIALFVIGRLAVPVAVADRALSRRHGVGSRLPGSTTSSTSSRVCSTRWRHTWVSRRGSAAAPAEATSWPANRHFCRV